MKANTLVRPATFRAQGRAALTSSGAFQPANPLPTNTVAQQRIPLQQSPQDIKRKIQHQFEKEKADKYFRLLGQFIIGEITKVEFDAQLKTFLTEPQRKLHNLFILTILRSTYCSLSPSPISRQDTRAPSYLPTLCVGPKEINSQPSWQRLQSHMEWISTKMGIDAVDNAAVSALLIALEQHMKSVMFTGNPSRRHFQKVPIAPIEQHLAQERHQEVLHFNRPSVVQVHDVAHSVNSIPSALSRKRVAVSDLDEGHIWRYHFTTQHQTYYINSNQEQTEEPIHQQKRRRLLEGPPDFSFTPDPKTS